MPLGGYSLTLDQDKALARNFPEREILHAHLVYHLLMNRRLIISDSQLLMSPNLRTLLKRGNGFFECFNGDTVSVAHRQDSVSLDIDATNKRFITLGKIKNQTIRRIQTARNLPTIQMTYPCLLSAPKSCLGRILLFPITSKPV
jgi:hypothetical protein